MDLLVVGAGVTDHMAFRQISDEDGPECVKSSTSMFVGLIGGDRVAIGCHGVNMPAMAAFMGSVDFRDRTSSVRTAVTIYQLSELAPPVH